MGIGFGPRKPPRCTYQLTKWLRRIDECESVTSSLERARIPYVIRSGRNGYCAVFIPLVRAPGATECLPCDERCSLQVSRWGDSKYIETTRVALTELGVRHRIVRAVNPVNKRIAYAVLMHPEDAFLIRRAPDRYDFLKKAIRRAACRDNVITEAQQPSGRRA